MQDLVVPIQLLAEDLHQIGRPDRPDRGGGSCQEKEAGQQFPEHGSASYQVALPNLAWKNRAGKLRGSMTKRIQVQGVHHITLVGSTRQSAMDFWQGVLGMPFILEQPNLGKPDENHLYFDPGDGRLITVFTNESRADAGRDAPARSGAWSTSRSTSRARRFSRLPHDCRRAASRSSSAIAGSWTRSTCTMRMA